MKTALHNKLEKMCKMQRKGDRHWFLTGPATIWLPEIQQIATTRRAIYAAFIGDVPEGVEVRATCGLTSCVCPQHAGTFPSKTPAKSLSLHNHLKALGVAPGFAPKNPDGIPPELNVDLFFQVKKMSGATLQGVRAATHLPIGVIMRIRGGAYDSFFYAKRRKVQSAIEDKIAEVRSSEVDRSADEEAPWLRAGSELDLTKPSKEWKEEGEESPEQVWLSQMLKK